MDKPSARAKKEKTKKRQKLKFKSLDTKDNSVS